jgi:hypothetical protein
MEAIWSILAAIGGMWVVYRICLVLDEYFASKRLAEQRARYQELVRLHGEPSPDSDFWAIYLRPPGSL